MYILFCDCIYVGALGEKEISAFSIMFQVEGFAWMVSNPSSQCCRITND